jgi:hypothetical protein
MADFIPGCRTVLVDAARRDLFQRRLLYVGHEFRQRLSGHHPGSIQRGEQV